MYLSLCHSEKKKNLVFCEQKSERKRNGGNVGMDIKMERKCKLIEELTMMIIMKNSPLLCYQITWTKITKSKDCL